jgi:hypothetical protein
MQYTTNAKMNLPDYTDVIDIKNLNDNFNTVDGHLGNKSNPHGVTAEQIGAATPGVDFSVTLTANGWSDGKQTVSNSNLLSSGCAYIYNPDESSWDAYVDAMIHFGDVTQDGTVTAYCDEAPSQAIAVNFTRIEVS